MIRRCALRPRAQRRRVADWASASANRALFSTAATSTELDALQQAATTAARAGAAEIWARIDKPRAIELKGATDLVTDTDKASENAVLAALFESCKDHAVLGEESWLMPPWDKRSPALS